MYHLSLVQCLTATICQHGRMLISAWRIHTSHSSEHPPPLSACSSRVFKLASFPDSNILILLASVVQYLVLSHDRGIVSHDCRIVSHDCGIVSHDWDHVTWLWDCVTWLWDRVTWLCYFSSYVTVALSCYTRQLVYQTLQLVFHC